MRLRILGAITAIILLVGIQAATAKPAQNVSAHKHPNLAAAQHLCEQAFEKVGAAQRANEFDLGGHAAKAKELLEQANAELKQAALTSNEVHR